MRLLLLMLLLCFLFPVKARENNQSVKISPKIYQGLKKTELLIEKKSYQQAEKKLKAMLANVKQKSYGQAILLRSLATVYSLNNQYNQAIDALSRCLVLNVLPAKQQQQLTINLGQIYMAVSQYDKAIQILEPYLAKSSKPEAALNALLANAYAQLKQYHKALSYIKKAISNSEKPKESWYQLMLALFFELKNYPVAADTLKTLIRLNPDEKTYWNQLSSVYRQLKQYKKAVSIKQLAYKKELLNTEQELLDFANILLAINSPYQAAKLIQNEIAHKQLKNSSENWETLANAWTIAKEFNHATKALEMAAKLNPKGSLYQRLGQIYIEQEKWKLAINALNKAINKAGLKNKGEAYLLLGMSYYEMAEIKLAEQSFIKATKYNKNNKTALQWLSYMRPETPALK